MLGLTPSDSIAFAICSFVSVSGEPLLLIMDEPFKGLDPTLRKKVIDTVDDIVCHTGSALILVTHESGEAVALGCEQIALKPKRRDVNRWH